jgi:pimeloyl-ACP methyl ester carboxylesterase
VIVPRTVPPAKLRQNVALMPQAVSEYAEAGRLDGDGEYYRAVAAATLLLHGGPLSSRFSAAVARLREMIPQAETAHFPAFDHAAPENQPREVADAVLRFFAAHGRPGAALTGIRTLPGSG